MTRSLVCLPLLLLAVLSPARAGDLTDAVQRDYHEHPGALFEHFHRNPEPSHHSPLFRIDPEPAVRLGVEATVVGLIELLGR